MVPIFICSYSLAQCFALQLLNKRLLNKHRSEQCIHQTVSAKDLSDGGEEIRKSPPRLPLHARAHVHTHAHARTHTLPPSLSLSQKAHQYLCQLQHHSVIHIKLSWNRLNEVSAAHRDDAEASAQCLQFLDGPDQVVSEVRKSCLKTLGRPDLATMQFQLCPGQYTLIEDSKGCTTFNYISKKAGSKCTKWCLDIPGRWYRSQALHLANHSNTRQR